MMVKIIYCLFVLFSLKPVTLLAAHSENHPVHWAYSAFFGTGWYQLQDSRSVFAVNLPVTQTLRSSSISTNGQRKIGIEIDYPLTVGFHTIDDLPGLVQADNFGTVIFTPGVELEIPITQRWYLRPFVNIGWGSELGSGGNSAWIYYTGLKSRYILPTKSTNWVLINSVYYAGYKPKTGLSDDLAALLTGLEYRQALKKIRVKNEAIDLHWSFSYTYLAEELDFGLSDGTFESLDDQFEAAVAFAYRKRPIKLWFMEFDNIGLGYRFSSNGKFKGISLNLGSWFTR